MITDDRLWTGLARPPIVDPARMVLVTPPSVEPWVGTDSEVQQWFRLDSADDAATITRLLAAARRYFERVTGLSLISQQWRADFDRLPRSSGYPLLGFASGLSFTGREIELPRTPLISIDSVKYKAETSGALTVFDPSNYSVGTTGNAQAFARLWLNSDASWPDLGDFPQALQVTLTCGFGPTAASIPQEITTALLMLAAHWYENRLPVSADGLADVPLHLQSLIEMNRVAFIA